MLLFFNKIPECVDVFFCPVLARIYGKNWRWNSTGETCLFHRNRTALRTTSRYQVPNVFTIAHQLVWLTLEPSVVYYPYCRCYLLRRAICLINVYVTGLWTLLIEHDSYSTQTCPIYFTLQRFSTFYIILKYSYYVLSCRRIVKHACVANWEDEECTENFGGENCPETYILKTEQGRKDYPEIHVEEGSNEWKGLEQAQDRGWWWTLVLTSLVLWVLVTQ